MKENDKIGVIIIGVILIVAFAYLIGINQSSQQPTAQAIAQTNQPKSNCRDVQEPYQATETYTETVPYTETVCETKQLIYKSTADNMTRNVVCTKSHQECQNYVLGICSSWNTVCDEYTETATLEITNLDTERGNWNFQWQSYCRWNQPLCKGTENVGSFQSMIIDPSSTSSRTTSITYPSNGQEVLYVNFTYIPTKQVCRDVTNYKDVQRTRTVTQYRTVTKCD